MFNIPKPQDIGLSEKFQSWRPYQEETIHLLLTDTKRITGLNKTTGSGKSVDYTTFALLSQKPTCIVTANRGLQNQLMEDFESVGMVDIRGRRNYDCGMKPEWTCEDGYATRCPYKGTVSCPSSRAEMRASASSLVVTNYEKWIAARRFGLGMQHFQQVIFDEGHHAYTALAKAMQVTLNHKEIEEGLKIDFLKYPQANDMVHWKDWAMEAKSLAEIAMQQARERMNSVGDPKPTWVRHFTHMRNLVRRLAIIGTARATNWVVEEVKEGFQFDPIRPGIYAEGALLLRVPRVVIVSATLRPKGLYMLGIAKDQFTFKEFPSSFDPARSPIYYVPTMRVDHKAEDLSSIWLLHDQIAARRRDRKGITHTISYARRDDVLANSRFAHTMLINQQGEPPTEMIEEFRDAEPGTELVSPSVGTGYDFPGRDCEWQFICKVPFIDGRSKINKAREEDDKEYGIYTALQTLQQIPGRGMRRPTDQCETFIGDKHMDWVFSQRHEHLMSKSFIKLVKRVVAIPRPPKAL